MADQLVPRTSNVCSTSPYSNFLHLQGWTPAINFCVTFEAKYSVPSTSGCNGNALCSVLQNLSKCDKSFIETVCVCIGVKPSTTISVPKSSSTPWVTSTTKAATTAKSSTGSSSKSNTPSSTKASAASSSKASTSVSSTTSTSSAASATPTCTDGVMRVTPTPPDLICEQSGSVFPTNWDILSDPSATSVENCAALCLAAGGSCLSFEYDPETADCQMFGDSAAGEGFIAVPDTTFSISDAGCFQACST